MVDVPGFGASLRGGYEEAELSVEGVQLGVCVGTGAVVGAGGVGAELVTLPVVYITLVGVCGVGGVDILICLIW